MPRWSHLCKEGEEPTSFIGMDELQKELGCKYSVGWSDIPVEWLPAVKELVEKIREHWTVDGAGVLFSDDKTDERNNAVVRIEQIKDKFGGLRFYYHFVSDDPEFDIWDEVDALVDECEKRLDIDDPHYNVPY